MTFFNYFKLYKLVEPVKGVFIKSFIFMMTQIMIVNWFYTDEGLLDLSLMLLLIGIFSVFIYTHSQELNKAQLMRQYPITAKKRFLYDLIAPIYTTFLIAIVYLIFVLILNIILYFTGYEYGEFDFALDFSYGYGVILYFMYFVMVFFSIQPLKYIVDKTKWYIGLGVITISFITYNLIVSFVLIGQIGFRNNLFKAILVYEHQGLLVAILSLLTLVVIVVSTKVALKIAKQ